MGVDHITTARFSCADGAALLAYWRAEYARFELEPDTPAADMLVARMDRIRVRMQAAGQAGLIEIAADSADILPDYRSWISGVMQRFDAQLPPLAWSGVEDAGALPPTLGVGTVVDCVALGASWWRMTVGLSAEGYARFSSTEHWHFRLLRPLAEGRRPVWPRLDAHGVIQWPEGEDALIDRIFTIRSFDPATRQVCFDIFRHIGGPTSDWAATMPVCQTVGLMGPIAKAGPTLVPGTTWLITGGDETSIPAILRGLEELPEGSLVDAVLLVGSASDITPMDRPGLSLTWLIREEGATDQTLCDAIYARLNCADAQTGLWFAGNKAIARTVRNHATVAAGLSKAQVHAVAYWG